MDVIYLDHNATTPLLAEAAQAMAPWQTTQFGNPSSQHQVGRRARQALEDAREGIARLLGASLEGRQPDRVILTSGGTEANNLALFGLADHEVRGPGQAIISAIEHPSVAAVATLLESRGWQIDRLPVSATGVVQLDALDGMLAPETRFVSVMLANNETGVVQPVPEIARRCADLGVAMHTDAVQMAGKLPIDFRALGVTSLAVAAHKFQGPLGAGALLTRHAFSPRPLLHGGFQQAGLRPGTESVALAVGMHTALVAWQRDAAERLERMTTLRDSLEQKLAAGYPGQTVINGAGSPRLPQTTNLAFRGLERQALLMALDLEGVACSTGSACASGSSEPSAILAAMGCEKAVLAGSIRLSLGATTTPHEVDEAIRRILRVVEKLAGFAAGKLPASAV